MKFYGFWLEANIQFYKVVRGIPQKYYVQIYTNEALQGGLCSLDPWK